MDEFTGHMVHIVKLIIINYVDSLPVFCYQIEFIGPVTAVRVTVGDFMGEYLYGNNIAQWGKGIRFVRV